MSYNRCTDTHKFENKYLPSVYKTQVNFRSHFSGKKVRLIVREIRYFEFHCVLQQLTYPFTTPWWFSATYVPCTHTKFNLNSNYSFVIFCCLCSFIDCAQVSEPVCPSIPFNPHTGPNGSCLKLLIKNTDSYSCLKAVSSICNLMTQDNVITNNSMWKNVAWHWWRTQMFCFAF